MRASKVFLLIAAVCLTFGLLLVTRVIAVGSLAAAYVLLPIGVVFAEMYLIWRALENQPAQSAGEAPSSQKTSDVATGCGCTCSSGRRD